MLLSSTAWGEPFIAVGDSVTASHDSWANVIRDRGTRVRLLAQNGRTIRDYDLPRDLKRKPNYRRVVYFLGINDIVQGTRADILEQQFRAHMRLLRERRFEVVVLVPPTLEHRHRDASAVVRGTLLAECTRMQLECHDLDDIWDYSWTNDSVHPTPEGHRVLADYVEKL